MGDGERKPLQQPFYRDKGFKKGDLPESEKFAINAITLPLFPELKNKEQDFIVKKLKEILEIEKVK